jgi:hypothetical protein
MLVANRHSASGGTNQVRAICMFLRHLIQLFLKKTTLEHSFMKHTPTKVNIDINIIDYPC